MDKFNSIVFNLLKYLSPIVALASVLDWLGFNDAKPGERLSYYFFEIAGWMTILWCAVVIYTFFAIAFNEKVKNSVVRKLAGIKEHDERETYLTGLISKKTFISITGGLVLLLFLSALKINIYKASEAEIKNGKHGTISIGMGLSLLAPQNIEHKNDEINRSFFFKYNGLPLSTDGTLLLIIILQMGTFYYFSKKENIRADE